MKQAQFKVNSQIIPQNFNRDFDAHIYFELENMHDIQKFISYFKEYFLHHIQLNHIFVGEFITQPIGPHPMPMIEINFNKDLFSEVTLWLMKNRIHHQILIHPLTDNDYIDHTQNVIWLGDSLKLNLSEL